MQALNNNVVNPPLARPLMPSASGKTNLEIILSIGLGAIASVAAFFWALRTYQSLPIACIITTLTGIATAVVAIILAEQKRQRDSYVRFGQMIEDHIEFHHR